MIRKRTLGRISGSFFILAIVALAFSGVSGRSTQSGVDIDTLVAFDWKWSNLARTNQDLLEVEDQSKYVLRFGRDGVVNIQADCNRVTANYKIEGNDISITTPVTTLASCPGDSKADVLLDSLTKAKKISMFGVMLSFSLSDEGAMTFLAPGLGERCGAGALETRKVTDRLDPAVSEKLDAILKGFLDGGTRSAPGASMLVITPTGRYFKSAGVADVSSCRPLSADSYFQIGSNTKMMTSAIIFQLQEEGRLSIDDPIGKWLPDLAARIPNGGDITIGMLLSHTSGIPDYFGMDTGNGRIEEGVNKREMLTRGFTPGELVEIVIEKGTPGFKPGEAGKWSYSNTGYILLGMIIEKATGKTYERNLTERVIRPLGMKRTFLQKAGPRRGTIPTAYYQAPFIFATNDWNASQGWSAGAVVSTSQEFAVFLRSLYTGKLFKNKETLTQMITGPAAGENALGENTAYAYGVLKNNGVLGHGGETLGFQSDGGYIPGKDVTIVIWGNSALNTVSRDAVPKIAEAVTGEQ